MSTSSSFHYGDVPYFKQSYQNDCWVACARMLLRGKMPNNVTLPKANMVYKANRGLRDQSGKQRSSQAFDAQSQKDPRNMGLNPGALLVDAVLNPGAEEVLDELGLLYSGLIGIPIIKDLNDFLYLLKSYGPFAARLDVSQNVGHWVLVIGVAPGAVIYHDPDVGPNQSKTVMAFAIAVCWHAPIHFFWSKDGAHTFKRSS